MQPQIAEWVDKAARSYRRTHDLAHLMTLGPDLWPALVPYTADLTALTVYAVAFRYPGATAGRAEAEAAVATMDNAHTLIRDVLGLPSP